MTVKAATVEQAVEAYINALDFLIGAIVAQSRYPLDQGVRLQYQKGREDLRQTIISLLMLIDIID